MKKFIYTLALVLILNSAFLIQNCFSQWQPDVRLTNNDSVSFTSFNNAWCVASSGLFVHVVWYDHRDGNSMIYYKRSTDAGLSWGADVRMTNNSFNSYDPSISVSGSVVHIVWSDNRDGQGEIYFKRSTDAGINWGIDTRLTNNIGSSLNPSIAVAGSVVHLVWWDNRDANFEIYYKRSTDSGVSWGTDTRLTNNYASSYRPSVAVSGSFVHIVWEEFRDLNNEIYYKRSTDAGLSWGADIRLTNNSSSSRFSSVAVSGSVVHVDWYDYRDGNAEIYYKRSTDAGISWGTDTRLTNDTSISAAPSISVSGSVVHIVWCDYRDGNKGEIYYKHSTDTGVSWEADTRLTNDSGFSGNPSIALSGSVVHVVWQDFRDGNYEIYYKRNPTGNVGIQNISTEIPSKYSLGQNYPNPFNSTSNLKFEIANLGNVRITVFDVSGREVETLVNERLQPGTYSTQWNASNYTSGVYFYKMQTESFTETKKLILLK